MARLSFEQALLNAGTEVNDALGANIIQHVTRLCTLKKR